MEKSESVSGKCPNLSQLRKYVADALPQQLSNYIFRHTEHCRHCARVLAEVSQENDARLFASADGQQIDLHGEMTAFDLTNQTVENDVVEQPRESSRSTDHDPRETISSRTVTKSKNNPAFPETIGPYEIVDQIGAGGMGTVFRAIHTRMNREVALKLLPAMYSGDSDATRRFDREMKAVGSLDHPNIVTGFDAGEADGHCYLAMEFLRGADLSRLASIQNETLAIGDACEIIRQAALALQYAHQNGIFHRDVKPSNIMLCDVVKGATDSEGQVRVKLLDLGLARFEQRDANQGSLTALSEVLGTVCYMSPEQCLDGRIVDARSDIYSLGATLYRLVIGEPVWPSRLYETVGQKLQALLFLELASVETMRSDLPPELIKLIDKSLKRDPVERYQSIDELIDDLTPLAVNHDLSKLLRETNEALAEQDFELKKQNAQAADRHDDSLATIGNPCQSLTATSPAIDPDPTVIASLSAGGSKVWTIGTGVALTALAALFAALVFWLKTDGGYLRVQADPSVNVSIDVLKDGQKVGAIQTGGDGEEWWYRSGSYEVRLPSNARDNLTISDDIFTLTRGGISVVTISKVTESQRSSEMAANNGNVGEEVRVTAARTFGPVELRNIVEWVLSNDGTVVTGNGEIKEASEIPDGEFEIHRIGLRDVDNAKARKICALIDGLEKCDQLYLNGGRGKLLTDDAMEAIGQVAQLKSLVIESAKITDAGVRNLPRMPQLKHLGLLHLLVTEQCLATASVKFPKLESLNIYSLSLRDNDLKLLTSMEHLRKLDLNTPDVTRNLIAPILTIKIDTMCLRGVDHFEAGVGEMLAQLPELTDLLIQNSKFDDDELQGLSKSTSLKFLRLSRTEISVDGLREFIDQHPDIQINLESANSPLQKLKDLPQVNDVSNGR